MRKDMFLIFFLSKRDNKKKTNILKQLSKNK